MTKKKEKFTYVDPEGKNRDQISEVLRQFDACLRSYHPLPLEWLHDSLEAGYPLDHDPYHPTA